MNRALRVAIAIVLAGTACTSKSDDPAPPQSQTASPSASNAPTTSAPTFSGRDFYQPPSPLPKGEPGAVIWTQAAHTDSYRAWRVLYHSRTLTGQDVAVSGALLTPTTPPPPGGYPVLAWAHGTTGLADECAPSRATELDPEIEILLQNGYAVAATDYQGLGTPGLHHYAVGVELGNNVLDMARAAKQVDAAATGPVLIAGWSQGGTAALWAGQLAERYAPELAVVGVLAAAPGANLTGLATALSGGEYAGYLVMAVVGLNDAYPNTSLDVLGPFARQHVEDVKNECANTVLELFANRADLVSKELASTEPWTSILAENTPGATAVKAPILIVQGTEDEQVPARTTQALVPILCAAGSKVELQLYEGAGHASVLEQAALDVIDWVQARRLGKPTTADDC